MGLGGVSLMAATANRLLPPSPVPPGAGIQGRLGFAFASPRSAQGAPRLFHVKQSPS